MMKRLKSIPVLLITTLFLLSSSFSISAQDTTSVSKKDTAAAEASASAQVSIAEGKKLFEEHCTQCHMIDRELVGPALAGINKRRPEDWLIKWIQNSQKLVKQGNDYAVKIFEEYNQQIMPPNPLNNQEVKSVLAYIKDASQQDKAAQASGGAAGPANIYSSGSIMNDGTFKTLAFLSLILLMVLLYVSFNILTKVLKLNNALPHVNWNKVNAYIFGLFFAGGVIGILYEMNIHTQYLLPEAVSKHGKEIDQLFNITLIITGVVFVITQILLFYFSFVYTRKKENDKEKALYYPVNDKLEIFWTIIPTIALTILIVFGFITWQNINSPRKEQAQVIEVYGYQFDWKFRYPGEDGKLGESDFTRTQPGSNPLGLNPDDPHAKDDIITSDLHLPVDKQVYFKIRSRDVIHSAYLPHFRVQMYAQPGVNTSFKFTPTKTTNQMRKQLNDKDFSFEMACNQICGAAHYNMKANVVVQQPDSFQSWLAKQQTFKAKLKQFASR